MGFCDVLLCVEGEMRDTSVDIQLKLGAWR